MQKTIWLWVGERWALLLSLYDAGIYLLKMSIYHWSWVDRSRFDTQNALMHDTSYGLESGESGSNFRLFIIATLLVQKWNKHDVVSNGNGLMYFVEMSDEEKIIFHLTCAWRNEHFIQTTDTLYHPKYLNWNSKVRSSSKLNVKCSHFAIDFILRVNLLSI